MPVLHTQSDLPYAPAPVSRNERDWSNAGTNTAMDFYRLEMPIDNVASISLSGASMDPVIEISASEPAFSEEQLLLDEFTHRTNNEFASAISIVALAAARSTSEEVKVALATAQDRLQNYARVQHALQMPEHGTFIDATAYLRQLCRAISRSKLDSQGIELLFVERPVWMNSERSWRVGMIVSELITNAARHGFNGRTGVIRVVLMSSSREFVECCVSDDGMAQPSVRPGRGLKIIEALVRGLGGKIEQHFGLEGTVSVVVFPKSR
jgi:two-component sensor histidine kinase